jgi:hypothetical protein
VLGTFTLKTSVPSIGSQIVNRWGDFRSPLGGWSVHSRCRGTRPQARAYLALAAGRRTLAERLRNLPADRRDLESFGAKIL